MALLDAVPVYVTREVNGVAGYLTLPAGSLLVIAVLLMLNLLLWGAVGVVQALSVLF